MFTRLTRSFVIALCLATSFCLAIPALAEEASFTRTEDVIYGRKYGLAMTMDVFMPKEHANGLGIVWCCSGGWVSSKPDGIGPAKELVDRGYVVFAVVHGSQPKFTIPEVLDDMHRAVRFIKAHSQDYKIDPEKLGICGGSAGGHLSLMQGFAPKPGDPNAKDPVERQSSSVAAVACFFPPTDFLNYGEEGNVSLGDGSLHQFRPPFEFWEREKESNRLVIISDPARRQEIGKQISPIYFVTKDSPPTLIIHGDADPLVPIQQSQRLIAKLKEDSVPCELIVRQGAGHSGPAFANDPKLLADWFDKYLRTSTASE
jgi:acetyl esterase/lipase